MQVHVLLPWLRPHIHHLDRLQALVPVLQPLAHDGRLHLPEVCAIQLPAVDGRVCREDRRGAIRKSTRRVAKVCSVKWAAGWLTGAWFSCVRRVR